MHSSEIAVTVRIVDPDLGDDERESLALQIIRQIEGTHGELGYTDRPTEEAPPNVKGMRTAIVGAFRALLDRDRLRRFFVFLSERLRGRPVELEIAAHGRVLRARAGSARELGEAIDAACRFIESPGPTVPQSESTEAP